MGEARLRPPRRGRLRAPISMTGVPACHLIKFPPRRGRLRAPAIHRQTIPRVGAVYEPRPFTSPDPYDRRPCLSPYRTGEARLRPLLHYCTHLRHTTFLTTLTPRSDVTATKYTPAVGACQMNVCSPAPYDRRPCLSVNSETSLPSMSKTSTR